MLTCVALRCFHFMCCRSLHTCRSPVCCVLSYVVYVDVTFCFWTAAITDLLIIPRIIYECGAPRWNDTDTLKPKNSEKTCPSATLSTTNPTWTDPEANPCLHCKMPVTNLLNRRMAFPFLRFTYSLQHPVFDTFSGLPVGWDTNFHTRVEVRDKLRISCLIFLSLDRRREDKKFWTAWYQAFYEFRLLLTSSRM
jgi:hypothetical protein